jgi:hypothetical protein
MNISHMAAIIAAGMLLAIPLMTPAYSEDKTAIATIEQPTCGLALGAENLDFGTLMPDAIAPANSLDGLAVTLVNTGTAVTSGLSLSGTDWGDADPDIIAVIIPATATHWSITSNDAYADMNAVNTVTTIPGVIVPQGQLPVYFRLQADLASGHENFAGGVTQTLTFISSC